MLSAVMLHHSLHDDRIYDDTRLLDISLFSIFNGFRVPHTHDINTSPIRAELVSISMLAESAGILTVFNNPRSFNDSAGPEAASKEKSDNRYCYRDCDVRFVA